MNTKVSTSYLFDSATQRMTQLQQRLSKTQAQMATTKQILAPSDAPDQAATIERLRGELQRQESHTSTLKAALQRYTAEETALSSSNDILTRLKELAVQAANDTVGSDDRASIAVEMKSLRDQLLSLGNSRDDNGNYLFSGTRVGTPAFAEDDDGYVRYQGDQTQTRIPAGVERTVSYTRAGTDVFSRVVRPSDSPSPFATPVSVGFFDSLDDTIQAVEAGDTTAMKQGLDELDQMQSGLNLALAKTGSDQNVVQSQMDVLDETTLRLKSTLSDIEDLDYTEAVTRMKKEMTALEAAMSSFGQISGLSLFNYVK